MKCINCIYHSERVARAIPENNHNVEALCLNSKSDKYGEYCFATDSCPKLVPGRDEVGAVDDPYTGVY